MASTASDKKHLVPLLEFLKFISERERNNSARFPKKINGVTELKDEASDFGSEQDSLMGPPEYPAEFLRSQGQQHSPLSPLESTLDFSSAFDRRKRPRTPENAADLIGGEARVPVECEVVSKSPGKGRFTSKYVDISLDDLGLRLVLNARTQPLTKEVAKQIQGLQCCYLLLGTSMIVAGNIIEASLTDAKVLVSPEKGVRVGLEWIPLDRVYQVPHNIAAVREETARRIERIMEAERCGDHTPALSPVELAKNPDPLSFPEVPHSVKKETSDEP